MKLSRSLALAFSAIVTGCGSDEGSADTASIVPYGQPGQHQTVRESASSADCTILRPAELAGGGPWPIVIWGNGTLASPDVYLAGLTHLASHGFIVAAANTSNAGRGTEMAACLDYLVAENTRSVSPYAGHVDTAHVGASGHSQGGGGSLMLGRDARITATAPLEPYTDPALFGHDPASWSSQHGPMLMFSGAEDTIAAPSFNQAPVFAASNVATVWATQAGADHVDSAIGDFGNFRAPMTAWFRHHLAGDEAAGSIFYPDDCTLCDDPLWSLQKKNL